MRAVLPSLMLSGVLCAGLVVPLQAQGPAPARVGIEPLAREVPAQPVLPRSVLRDHRTTGALVGGGLFAGALLYLSSVSDSPRRNGTTLPLLAIGGAMVGGGALLGSLLPKE